MEISAILLMKTQAIFHSLLCGRILYQNNSSSLHEGNPQ